MIADFIDIVTQWISGIIEFITTAFEGIVQIFYDSSPEGGGFTFYGILMLFALAVGFVSLALGWLTRLLKK